LFLVSVETPDRGVLRPYIGAQPAELHLGQGNISILAAFALANMNRPAVEVQFLELQVAKLETAQATTIKHGQH
jgi:hypothetical protein